MEDAAIAQSVERILGKDEVASSNLASSSKKTPKFRLRSFFFVLTQKLVTSSAFAEGKFQSRGRKAPMGLGPLDRVASSNLASSSNQSVDPIGSADFFCFRMFELATSY